MTKIKLRKNLLNLSLDFKRFLNVNKLIAFCNARFN